MPLSLLSSSLLQNQKSDGEHQCDDEYIAPQHQDCSYKSEHPIDESVRASTDEDSNMSSIIPLPAISPNLAIQKLLGLQRVPHKNCRELQDNRNSLTGKVCDTLVSQFHFVSFPYYHTFSYFPVLCYYYLRVLIIFFVVNNC